MYTYSLIKLLISRISKGAALGSYLQGMITFCKDEIGKRVDMHTFKFVLSDATKKIMNQNAENDKDKSKWDEFNESLRDLRCHWLAKLGELRIAYKIRDQ